MPLFPADPKIEEILKNAEFRDLSPEQKNADMNKISQALAMYPKRTRKKRFTIMTIGSVSIIVLAIGFFKIVPNLYHTTGGANSTAITTSTPVLPSTLSKDADLLWKNGTATHAFITYNGYFYIATGQLINNEEELGQKLGKVERLGDDDKPWVNFESNYFPLGTLFALRGTPTSDKIVLRFFTDAKKGSAYGIFKRDAPLGQQDPKTITGAKNNPANVALALQNVQNQFPEFYQFHGDEHYIQEVVFEPSFGPGVRLTYQFPSGKFLYLYEYKKDLANENETLPDSDLMKNRNTNPISQKTQDLNGIHWSFYSDSTIRGEQGDYYYEINQSGFTLDQDVELLKEFKIH